MLPCQIIQLSICIYSGGGRGTLDHVTATCFNNLMGRAANLEEVQGYSDNGLDPSLLVNDRGIRHQRMQRCASNEG